MARRSDQNAARGRWSPAPSGEGRPRRQ